MKEWLMKMLKAKQEQRDRLNAQLIKSDDKEEREAIGNTLKALADEIKEVEDKLKEVDAPADEQAAAPEEGQRAFKPMQALEMRNGEQGKI